MSLNVFGYSAIGVSTLNLEGLIKGTWFTAPDTGNIVSISAYISVTTASHTIKCGLYEYTADGNAGNLIAQTDQSTVGVGTGWTTFSFSSPVAVTAGTKYFLVAWSNATSGDSQSYYDSGSGRGVTKTETYVANFPSPLTGESSASTIASLYANYENGPLHTRISQAVVESLSNTNPGARVSQVVVEVLSSTQEVVAPPGLYRMFFAG